VNTRIALLLLTLAAITGTGVRVQKMGRTATSGVRASLTTLSPRAPAVTSALSLLSPILSMSGDIPQTEMYGGPFHVPAPDEVVFEEKWDKGEHFRSGCVWRVGQGRVFYFRPGHETYPIFQQAEPLRVVQNAVRWMGGKDTP
jgi:hypothetical protein